MKKAPFPGAFLLSFNFSSLYNIIIFQEKTGNKLRFREMQGSTKIS